MLETNNFDNPFLLSSKTINFIMAFSYLCHLLTGNAIHKCRAKTWVGVGACAV